MSEYGTERHTCPSVTLSTKDPTWTGLGSNLDLLEAEWVTCVSWVTGISGRGRGSDTSVLYSGGHRSRHKTRGWFLLFKLQDITLKSAHTASYFIPKD